MYCNRCLLPSNYLNIKLDENGICQHCRDFVSANYMGANQLLEDIQPALKKNTSKKYDCVVGFSGGRDSTYLLWFLVKKLHLRPLAVFSDDLFIPDVALENLKATTDILGVDLRIISHDNLKKCLPHHLKAWIRRPVPESLMFVNVGERIGYETLVENEAVKEGVHLLFGGRTPIQSNETYKTDLMKIGNRGGKLSWIFGYMKQVLLNPSLAMNLFCLKTQYKEFQIKKWKRKLAEKYDLTIIHPFYKYIHWEEKEIEKVLFDELNWQLPKGTKHTSRVGCEVDTLRQYFFYRTLGYNDTHVDLSAMIRDGMISREAAAGKLEESLCISENYIKFILNKAGVDADDYIRKLDQKYPRRHFAAIQIDD